MQIVGKVRLTLSPWINHSWHATLCVTARGLTTLPIPHGTRSFQIDFDFVDHELIVQTGEGSTTGFALKPMTVASFFHRLMEELNALDLSVKINCRPNEVADPTPFDQDEIQMFLQRASVSGR